MTPASEQKMGLLGAAALGIGGMVGGGIFAVLGTAVGLAHGATPVAFLIAGAIALLTAYAYAKLSAHFPSSGGTVVFIHEAYGHHLYTGAVNLLLWLNYLVTIALYASAFGSYAQTFLPHGESAGWHHAFVSLGILLPTAINLLGAQFIARSETTIVVIKLTLLLVVVAAGLGGVDTAALDPAGWPSWGVIVAGGMTIFVAYEGFELIANAGDDVADPATTLPRAFYIAVVFVLVLYVLLAIVTVGSVPEAVIIEAKDYALAAAAKPALGQAGFTLVAVSALLATFSAINATIYGNARLGFTLASEGELPKIALRRAWNRPVAGVLITSGLSLLLANTLDLEAIAIMGSAGFLLIFAVVNSAAAKLGPQIHARRWVAAGGALACVLALAILLHQTWEDNPHALYWVFGLVAGSFVAEAALQRWRGPVNPRT